MNFDFGGTVIIGEESEDAIVCMKFGYVVWIVKDDIECLKHIPDSPLTMISLKRKVQWRKCEMWSVPNFKQFKERMLNN